jgi:hypothetical protein
VILYAYLRNLIFVCVLPLLVLAVYLGVDDLQQMNALEDREAVNRIEDIGRAIDQTLTAHLGGLSMLADSPSIGVKCSNSVNDARQCVPR